MVCSRKVDSVSSVKKRKYYLRDENQEYKLVTFSFIFLNFKTKLLKQDGNKISFTFFVVLLEILMWFLSNLLFLICFYMYM